MIEIDGSEGGGQVVRTALALSALTGEGFRIEGVRGGRPTPGLRPQHLTAVELLAEVADAEVSDVSVGTEAFSFDPGEPRPGTYEADIGTAGSVTLLFDAVLPVALGTDGRVAVTARGGTDVKWAPPMAYYRGVKLLLLRRLGLSAAVDVSRTGFHPAGGGEATLHLGPSSLDPVRLTERGESLGVRVRSKASMDLEEREVAERQADAAVAEAEDAGLAVIERTATYVEAASTGSAVSVELDYGGTVAGANALGERGTPAEEVGAAAVEEAVAFEASGATVDRHMADQLVVLVALRGGRVAIPAVTDHVEAGCDLTGRFGLGVRVEGEEPPTLVGPPD